eukprot:TRINITY_DN1331_c0_g1_i1.p1 TRINITY_DN1331_c0_g1~~TRINITY_DN1331_c0_g1_i1.p1  ORF type:complete len:105 (-),score=37.98 TRINITY_DN1331_c0_g1_i1:420-734(-)
MSVKKSTRVEDEAAREMFYGPQVEEEGLLDALKRDFANRPFIYIGMTCGSMALGRMLWGLKNKPKDMKLSIYLIHTRMAMQGAVVGTLVLGMCHQLYTKISLRK